ncbi:MAG: fused MFS/spermidine synthase [Polyangiaceae bacterium]|nr:fused MFS/spermidine synthase [Polyangiaceae bacterium]
MSPRLRVVSLLFLLSGATGLLYEVAFCKVLSTIFGATAYAVSTVLSAFMAGLALGAFIGGRLADRLPRPLAAYGAAEVLVGGLCAATPSVFEALTTVYVGIAKTGTGLASLTAIRAVLTFLIILVPTACMGATLPFLSRIFAGDEEGQRRLPMLYATNTLGGALGSLAGAYLVLPLLGISGTMRAAALVNLAIGITAIVLGTRGEATPTPVLTTKDGAPKGESVPRAFLGFAFASGFLVFAAEVVQTHLLAVLIGNSAYAFGLMLAAFLVCLGLGATRAAALQARHGAGALARGLALAALGLAVMTPAWDQLPHIFTAAGKVFDSWGARELTRGVAAIAILAVPTFFMGTTFPLLLTRIASRPTVARDTARLTVANTVGTIFGSVTTGYFVLPRLGSQNSLVAVSVVFALLAALALWDAAEKRPTMRVTAAIAIAGAAIALLAPSWNLARLTNGANVYFTHGPPPDDIPFVREDVHGGITTVARRGDVLTMYTNGKFQGDDGREMSAQRRFAHFPGLFLRKERAALVIGLGTATTLGTVTAYPFEHIDVAEISPAIVEAADTFYKGPSRNSLHDKRVEMKLDDGRNVLLFTERRYDLITMELSSVWFAGSSALYSHEFYELAKSRLTEDGVLQQWVQLHHIRPREVAAIVRTLRGVFKHVALFEGGAQGILVASDHPLVASRARLERLDQDPAIRETTGGPPLSELLEEIITSEGDLDRFCEEVAKEDGGPIISTDDNLYLEYATPKGNVLNYDKSLAEMLGLITKYRTEDPMARHLGP